IGFRVLAVALNHPCAVVNHVVPRLGWRASHCGLLIAGPRTDAGRDLMRRQCDSSFYVPKFAQNYAGTLWMAVDDVGNAQQTAIISLILGQFSRPCRFIRSR